jgi:tripartite-type tricarboxylate transporter receptor subunit TctC
MTRWIWALAALLCAAVQAGPSAQAQETYPNRPITILIGFPPGGSVDLTARAIAPALERILGQPVLVQNRAGAAAAIGTQAAARAAPDGYTIAATTTQITVLPVVDEVFGRPPNFTRDEFQPIARISADPVLLFVNAEQPWKTLKELVDDAKKRPGQIVYASGGLHGVTHLPVEMFLKAAGIKMRHLPTAGGGPAMTAVLGNNAALLSSHPGVSGPQVKAGKLRPLASWGAERIPAFPDVPTFKELGYDIEYYLWQALFAPKGVPEPIIKILRAAVAKAVKEPDFLQAMEKAGSDVAYQDAPEFKVWWDQDSKRLEDIVRVIGKGE